MSESVPTPVFYPTPTTYKIKTPYDPPEPVAAVTATPTPEVSTFMLSSASIPEPESSEDVSSPPAEASWKVKLFVFVSVFSLVLGVWYLNHVGLITLPTFH